MIKATQTFYHFEAGSWLCFAEERACVGVRVPSLNRALCSSVWDGSAVSSCSTVILQTRGDSKGKRSDSWGYDEDRDCVCCSAWQRRL